MSQSQPLTKKSPTTPVRAHPSTPQAEDGIYTFDNLAAPPSQVPKKANSISNNIKEDLGHVRYAAKQQSKSSEEIYGFDHLNTSKLQQRVNRQGYDQVPLGKAKSKSPSPASDPQDQDDYIEPMNEDDLKIIKGTGSYERLSTIMVDQTYDRLQDSVKPPQQDSIKPPQLPKKKSNPGINSPAKPPPPPAPVSPVKVVILCTVKHLNNGHFGTNQCNFTVIQRLSFLKSKVVLQWYCRDHRTCPL